MLLSEKNVESNSEQKSQQACIYPTIRCILIEPDAIRASHLKNILWGQSMTEIVCTASTVEAALDYFKNEHEYHWPRLIIITATTIWGSEILAAIRSFQVFNRHIKIIVLGQLRFYDGLMQLFKEGLSAYLGPSTSETFLRYSVPLVADEGRYCLYLPTDTIHLCLIGYSPAEILQFDKTIGFEKLNKGLSRK
jgi:DNA-binding NarL/FixJ family response regulator